MASEIHKGDIGTVFEATIMDGTSIVDVSSATTQELYFKKQSGTTMTKVTTFTTDGTDGKIQWATTVIGDLDEVGELQIQGHVILPTGEWKTDIYTDTIYENLV